MRTGIHQTEPGTASSVERESVLFKKKLRTEDFATALVEAHRTFFSEGTLVRLAETLTIVIDPQTRSLATLEWMIFGIYAVAKGIEGNLKDAALRSSTWTTFLAQMHSQLESQASIIQHDLNLEQITADRIKEYNNAWRGFADSRAVGELGEAVSIRVLGRKRYDNLLVLPFGQLAISYMIETARFVQKVLGVAKLTV